MPAQPLQAIALLHISIERCAFRADLPVFCAILHKCTSACTCKKCSCTECTCSAYAKSADQNHRVNTYKIVCKKMLHGYRIGYTTLHGAATVQHLNKESNTMKIAFIPKESYTIGQIITVHGEPMRVESYTHTGKNVTVCTLPGAKRFTRMVCICTDAPAIEGIEA